MIKLLLVEDSEDVIDALNMYFDAFGKGRYDIMVAKNFQEAEALLETEKFDIVVTDFNFPGGDGDQVAQLAKELDVPKIYLHSADPEQAKSKVYTQRIKKLDPKTFKSLFF
jgi:DNA-binding response OmpR family regulator